MQPTSIQLSLSQAKADPSIAWARFKFLTKFHLNQAVSNKNAAIVYWLVVRVGNWTYGHLQFLFQMMSRLMCLKA